MLLHIVYPNPTEICYFILLYLMTSLDTTCHVMTQRDITRRGIIYGLEIKCQVAAGEAAGWAVSARFEHIVLEAALNVVCNNLLRRVRALSPAISTALKGAKRWDYFF